MNSEPRYRISEPNAEKGGGDQNSENFEDVVYGRSLSRIE